MPSERRAFGILGSLDDEYDSWDRAEMEREKEQEEAYRAAHPRRPQDYGRSIRVADADIRPRRRGLWGRLNGE